MTTMKSLINLPTPTNISTWWNFGSLLGLCLSIQILSGILLSMFYCPNITMAFESTMYICRNMNNGWFIRTMHSNGASMMFLFMYLHMGRSMYYSSFKMMKSWLSGIIMLMLMMMIAFMGYILPWGQMSFWGATVITNLISTIPIIGNTILEWLWGGFNINNATLGRMFSFHFITPFILSAMSLIHLMLIHEKGSNNPLGTNSNVDKIPFHPYFTLKDIVSLFISLTLLMTMILMLPYYLTDAENFSPANPLKTPLNIKPEWYFLFSYSILRSIPNKLGGVISMIMSIMMLLTIPMMKKKSLSSQFCPMNKLIMWNLLLIIIMLTWLSSMPLKYPFLDLNQMMTFMYFMMYPLMFINNKMWKQMNL